MSDVELNTQYDPTPRNFMDETLCLWCPKCHHRFRLGRGMDADPFLEMVTNKHLELCEGDAAATLLKVERWWQELHPPEEGVRMRIVAYAGGGPTPFDGEYVVSYDPAAPSVTVDGDQLPFTLITTPDKARAHVFKDAAAALAAYQQSHGIRPWDLRPNRPLSAWTVEIER